MSSTNDAKRKAREAAEELQDNIGIHKEIADISKNHMFD